MPGNNSVELDVRLNMDKLPNDFNNLEKEAKSGAEAAAEALDNMNDSIKKNAKEAKQSAEDMKDASDKLLSAIRSQESELADLKKAYLNTALEQGKSSEEARSLENRIEQLSEELADNKAKLKDAEYSTDDFGDALQELGENLDDTKEKVSVFGDVLKGSLASAAIEKGVESVSSAIGSVFSGSMEMQDANQKLAASTGATAQEMERYAGVMEELYKDNYGESIESVADNMALVRQYTGEVDASKLKELTENAIALDDTFENMDISETIRGIDALMTNMGLSAEEAFDYITVGAQNGLNKSGELTDNISEYSQLWGQSGFSAKEMFTILDNGLKSGAYNLDKVNDFVKEFSISLSDGRIEENIDSFSEQTQGLFEQWKNGEATTRDVFYSIISDLTNMTNQQEALTLASNTWSALGEDNAMTVITALDDVNATFIDVKGSMESLKDVRYDSLSSQYTALGRILQTDVAEPILEDFLPKAQKGIEVLTDNVGTIIPVAKTAGVMVATIWVVKKAKQFVKDVKDTAKSIGTLTTKLLAKTTATAADTAAETASTAATAANTTATTAQATATGAATVAQTGLNAAMLANPVIMLTAGIIAAGVALFAFSEDAQAATTETEELRNAADDLNEEMQRSQAELRDSLSSTREAVETTTSSVEAMRPVAEELAALADNESYTNEESDRMVTLVTQLKTIYPEMGIEIDKVTGKLSMGSKEILNYITNLENMAELEAYQQSMQASIDSATQAIQKRTLAQDKLNDLLEEQHEIERDINTITVEMTRKSQLLGKSQEELNGLLEDGTITQDEYDKAIQGVVDSYIEYNGEQRDANDVLAELNREQQKNEKTIENLTADVKNHNDIIEEAQEQAGIYAEKYNELTEKIEAATAAEQENAETVDAATKANITAAGQELEAFNNLSESQKQVAVDITNSVLAMEESLTSSISTQLGLFDELDIGASTSLDSILEGLNSQITGVETWEQNLTTLVSWGIDDGLLQTLIEAGPETGSAVQAIVDAGSERIGELNEKWALKEEVLNATNDAGEALKTSGAQKIAESFDGIYEIMEESGADTVIGFVNGVKNAQSKAEEVCEDLGVKLIDSVNSGLQVNSPSKATTKSGEYTGDGLVVGVKNKTGAVKAAGKLIAQAGIQGIDQADMYGHAVSAGENFGDGLAIGIASKTNKIAAQAAATVRSAINAANAEQNAHSPAKETIKVGHNFGDGTEVGIRDKIPDVKEASIDMMDEALSISDKSWAIDAINDSVYNRSSTIGRTYTYNGEKQNDSKRHGDSQDYMKRLAKEIGIVFAKEIEGMGISVGERQFGRVVRNLP